MKGQEGQIIVIDVHLTRGLVTLLILALFAACFAAHLAWGQERAIAADSQAPLAASANMRQFYLTPDSYDGASVLAACDSGYHMASLWEILDPSNLKYNTAKGYVLDDSGQGPPASVGGWIRTGSSSLSSAAPGYASCLAWTSSDGGEYGTTAWMGGPWTDARDIHVWNAGAWPCNNSSPVWCVEDSVSANVYLPLALRRH